MNITLANQHAPAFGKVLPNGILFEKHELLPADQNGEYPYIEPEYNKQLYDIDDTNGQLSLKEEFIKDYLNDDVFIQLSPETQEELIELSKELKDQGKDRTTIQYLLAHKLDKTGTLRKRFEAYVRSDDRLSILKETPNFLTYAATGALGFALDALSIVNVEQYYSKILPFCETPEPVTDPDIYLPTTIFGLGTAGITHLIKYLSQRKNIKRVQNAKNIIVNQK